MLPIDVSQLLTQDAMIFNERMVKIPFKLLDRNAQDEHPLTGEIVGRDYSTTVNIPCSIELRNIDRVLDNYNLKTEEPGPDLIVTVSKQWLSDNSITVDEEDKFDYAGGTYIIYQAVSVDYTPTEPSVPLHLLAKARLEQRN